MPTYENFTKNYKDMKWRSNDNVTKRHHLQDQRVQVAIYESLKTTKKCSTARQSILIIPSPVVAHCFFQINVIKRIDANCIVAKFLSQLRNCRGPFFMFRFLSFLSFFALLFFRIPTGLSNVSS